MALVSPGTSLLRFLSCSAGPIPAAMHLATRLMSGSESYGLDMEDESHTRPTTPWVRSVVSGVDLMRNSKYSKGLGFSHEERELLYIRGLLPRAVLSQEVQAERVLSNIRKKSDPVEQYIYIMSLQERNERLFFHILTNNIEELLPLLQYPTVGRYCQDYSLMFRSLPRGLFLSLEDRGSVATILKNWPERRVKAICLTDGSRVDALGDLGVQAIGVPISRLAAYTACGGILPSSSLPVVIDAGTDNEELLQDPIYVGARHRRIRGDPYFELVDELIGAVRRRYGSSVLVDTCGMSFDTESKLVHTYRGTLPCQSDALFGLPTAVLSGVLAALAAGGGAHAAAGGPGALKDQRFLLVGESPQLPAVAEMLAEAVQREGRHGTVLDARQGIWLCDSQGLVTRARADSSSVSDAELSYIQDAPTCPDVLSAAVHVKPTVVIGLSDKAPPFQFSQELCAEVARACARPVLMPLSQHGKDGAHGGSELTAADAYAWTGGRCLFADRHTYGVVELSDGSTRHPRPMQTEYIFPGLAMGTLMSRSTRVREEMFVEAAKAVARLVTDEDLASGALYPPVSAIRAISAHVAAAVAGRAYGGGVATELPRPHDLLERAEAWMYSAKYRRYK